MNDRLTEYGERGFAVLGEVLHAEGLRRLRGALEHWRRQRGTAGPYGILCNNVRCEIPAVADLVAEGGLATTACRFLGSPRVVLFQDNLVWKPAGAARIEWHQDYSYWPLDAPRGVTFWLALDDADSTNGCMHYIPGTHRLGERQPADFIAGSGQPARPGLPPLDWAARESGAVPAPVRAGELVIHHPLVWHMSPANGSSRQRRALTFSWIGPEVRWDTAHAPHPFNHTLRPADGSPVGGELFPCFKPGPAPRQRAR
jgi:hypothetical protein